MLNEFQYSTTNRQEVGKFLPEKYTTVLEVGCGTGGFRATLKNEIEIWGIEPNELAASQAEKCGYKMLVGFYNDVADQCPDHYFDMIVCNDVIEHMADYEDFLELIKRKMKHDGCIVGSIPNVRYFGNLCKLLLMRDWKYESHGVLDKTHLRFFTEKSLYRAFVDHQFSIQEIRGMQSDFGKWRNLISVVRNLVLFLLIACSFGHSKDMQYVQFGFRVKQAK